MNNFYLKVLRKSAYNFTMVTGFFSILFGSHYLLTTGLERLGYSFLVGQIVWIAIGIITFTIAHSIREIRGEENKKRGDTIDPK
jgi:hypothetical protein